MSVLTDKVKKIIGEAIFVSSIDKKALNDLLVEVVELAEGGGGESAFKSYIAVLEQTGVNIPSATILQDTIEGTSWSRATLGVYILNFETPIVVNKLHIPSFTDWVGSSLSLMPIATSTGGVNEIVGYYTLNSDSPNGLELKFYDVSLAPAEMSAIMTGSKLYLPEIRVYN